MPSRRPSRQLVQLFDQSPLPIYVVDEGRRIIYCNGACAEWLGVEAAQLAGETCLFQGGDATTTLDEAVSALCPPPQVFHGERVTAHVVWKRADGAVERRDATFVPLGGRDAENNSVIAVLGEPRSESEAPSTATGIDTAQELHERLQRLARQSRSRYRLDRLVGESLAMRRVREQVRVAIAGHSQALILGPPGSGREHVARTIHAGDSPEGAGPLLPLSCPLLDAEALQSAVLEFLRRCQDQQLKSAATILLLDVDELTSPAQAEMQAFLRVPTFTTRILATARRPLLGLAGEGSFLPELAFALSPLLIQLPSLHERREDIPLLAQRFVEEFNASGGKQLAGFAPAALDRLASLPWTGNIEELAEVVNEACRQVSTVWIGDADLPPRVRAVATAGVHPRRPIEHIRLDEFLLDVERELIQRAMRRARGNKAKAARLLGVSRPRLLRRLTQLGLATKEVEEIKFKLLDEDEGGE